MNRIFQAIRGSRKYSSLSETVLKVNASSEIELLVDTICRLNLIETSHLVSMLKGKLNLPDILPSASAAYNNQQNSPNPGNVAIETPKETKTEFRVTLEKFDPASKAKVIREIKTLFPNWSLVEAKKFVEEAPKLIKEKVKRDEAEKMKQSLESLGASITLD